MEGQPRHSGLNTAAGSSLPTPVPSGPAGHAALPLLAAPPVPPATARPAEAFPLLRLQPGPRPPAFPADHGPRGPPRGLPPPREAWGPRGSRQRPAPPGAWSPRPAAAPKPGPGTRDPEAPRHLNLDQYVGQDTVTPRLDVSLFLEPRGCDVAPPGPFGFPLLHLPPPRAFTFFSVCRAPGPAPCVPLRAAAGEGERPGFSFLPARPAPEDTVTTARGPSPHPALRTADPLLPEMCCLLTAHANALQNNGRILKVSGLVC